jgi:hypothetical protein
VGLEHPAGHGLAPYLGEHAVRHAAAVGREILVDRARDHRDGGGAHVLLQRRAQRRFPLNEEGLQLAHRVLLRAGAQLGGNRARHRRRARPQAARGVEGVGESPKRRPGAHSLLFAESERAPPALGRHVHLRRAVGQAADLAVAAPGMGVAVEGVGDTAQDHAQRQPRLAPLADEVPVRVGEHERIAAAGDEELLHRLVVGGLGIGGGRRARVSALRKRGCAPR